MISALTGDGVADLSAGLPQHVPAGPWLYPEDQISDAPLRQLAAEITREKLYLRLHQELPYQSTVETEAWKERRTARCASSRRSMSSARASARSCSARAGRPSRRSAPRRGKEIAEIARGTGAPVPVREGARGLGRRPGALPGDGAGVSEGVNVESMQWTDEGIVLGVRRHGEAQRHRRADDARAWPPSRPGARRRRARGCGRSCSPATACSAIWRARLDEHLGTLRGGGLDLHGGEPVRDRARGLWGDPSGERLRGCCPSAIRTRDLRRRSKRSSAA